jgi:hypothetical protein
MAFMNIFHISVAILPVIGGKSITQIDDKCEFMLSIQGDKEISTSRIAAERQLRGEDRRIGLRNQADSLVRS